MQQQKQNFTVKNTDWYAWIPWLLAMLGICAYLIYKLHDFTEPFAYGHARWSDAYFYWFGMMHLDLGLARTAGANVEGIADGTTLLYYRSIGPLHGLVQAVILNLFNTEPWSIRLLPFVANLLNLGLLAWLAIRWLDLRSVPWLVLLYLGMPFLLKYGTSNEGLFAITLTLGLTGWIFYQQFLESGRYLLLYMAMLLFAVGVGFSWHAGAMGLPVYLHMLFCRRPVKWKLKHLAAFSALMAGSIALILIHQGIATGDYLYPLRRVLERSSNLDMYGIEFSWIELGKVQITRVWQYFGPAVSILSGYWLLRRLCFPRQWQERDAWILALWSTGLFYGVLFRQAALIHDFLLLGFGPGLILAATAGAVDLIHDGRVLFARRSALLKASGLFIVILLLLGHALIGVRSAWIFEQHEADDLDGGEAKIPYFLRDTLTDNAILVADPSSGYHTVTMDDGKVFCNLRPHLAYLTRRPVRFIENSGDLKKLLLESQESGRAVALVQLHYTKVAERFGIPADTIEKKFDFADKATVYLWNTQ